MDTGEIVALVVVLVVLLVGTILICFRCWKSIGQIQEDESKARRPEGFLGGLRYSMRRSFRRGVSGVRNSFRRPGRAPIRNQQQQQRSSQPSVSTVCGPHSERSQLHPMYMPKKPDTDPERQRHVAPPTYAEALTHDLLDDNAPTGRIPSGTKNDNPSQRISPLYDPDNIDGPQIPSYDDPPEVYYNSLQRKQKLDMLNRNSPVVNGSQRSSSNSSGIPPPLARLDPRDLNLDVEGSTRDSITYSERYIGEEDDEGGFAVALTRHKRASPPREVSPQHDSPIHHPVQNGTAAPNGQETKLTAPNRHGKKPIISEYKVPPQHVPPQPHKANTLTSYNPAYEGDSCNEDRRSPKRKNKAPSHYDPEDSPYHGPTQPEINSESKSFYPEGVAPPIPPRAHPPAHERYSLPHTYKQDVHSRPRDPLGYNDSQDYDPRSHPTSPQKHHPGYVPQHAREPAWDYPGEALRAQPMPEHHQQYPMQQPYSPHKTQNPVNYSPERHNPRQYTAFENPAFDMNPSRHGYKEQHPMHMPQQVKHSHKLPYDSHARRHGYQPLDSQAEHGGSAHRPSRAHGQAPNGQRQPVDEPLSPYVGGIRFPEEEIRHFATETYI